MNLSEKLNNIRYQKIAFNLLILFLIIIFLLTSITLLAFQISNKDYQTYEIKDMVTGELVEVQICERLLVNETGFDPDFDNNINLSYSYKFIDIFPETKNIFCLGKVIEVWDDLQNSNSYHFLLANNSKIYNLLKVVINGLFAFFIGIFYFFKLKPKKIFYILQFTLLYFNFVLRFIFTNDLFGRFKFETYIILITFLFLTMSFVVKSKKVFFIGILFFLTLNYDYFSLYVVSYLLINKFDKKMNTYEKRAYLSVPFIFLTIRLIASLSKEFNLMWSRLYQKFYMGYSRFVDLQADFYILKCNSGNAPSRHYLKFADGFNVCTETIGYGPIRKIIPIYGDVWNTVLITLLVLFCFIYLQYKDLIKRYPEEVLILTLLFVSPPVNILIHLANPDIFYFTFLYFVLKKYETKPLTMSIIIYVFALWKVHAIGILFGFMFKSLVSENYKIFKINIFAIFLTVVTYIVDIYYTEPLTIPGSPDERWGYGILHDALQLTKYTNYGNNLHFILFTLSLWILVLYGAYRCSDSQQINDFKLPLSYETYGYSFWFFLTFIFQNQSYRLPLFLTLFFLIFIKGNFLLKTSVLLGLFFNPVFSDNIIFFEKLSLIANRFGIYMIFVFLLSLFFKDFYINFVNKYIRIGFLDKIYKETSKKY